jgi:hypothetical protein
MIRYLNFYHQYWTDYKLSWNESEYNGITEIRLPYDRIWKPVNV